MATRSRRIVALSAIFATLFVLISARLVLLAVFDGTRLKVIARSEHTETLEINAPRGPIVDRNGLVLALSAPASSIYARPRALLHNTSPKKRAQLAQLLKMSLETLEKRLDTKAHFVWLARQVDTQTASAIKALNIEGVGQVEEFKRFYPERDLAAAVIGVAGVDSQGLSGVEMRYDRIIRGTPLTLEVKRDALGRSFLDNPELLQDAQPGARLVLTLDGKLQSLVESEVRERVRLYRAQRGIAIVLDPFSGEILAMAVVDGDEDDKSKRLHNAAVEDVFEPGSTIKPLLAALALENHVVDLERKIYCENGAWHLARTTIHDHSAHRWLTLPEIIAVSSNIGAAKIALALGAKRYFEGLRKFGLGQPTGVDLPGEASGLLHPLSHTQLVELANQGFGQGVAVTALQLAAAYGAIANGGLLMRPHVVRAAYDSLGRKILQVHPEPLRRVISPKTAHEVALLMRGVVESPNGTGRLAAIPNVPVAGKTGTAQMVNPVTHTYYQHRLVASFVGFLPADDPRVVILVALEGVGQGRFGGLVAAPAFRAIALESLERLHVSPILYARASEAYQVAALDPISVLSGSAEESRTPRVVTRKKSLPERQETSSRFVPSFQGLSLRQALALAQRYNLSLDISGSGYVARQVPRPETPLPPGRHVKIFLSDTVANVTVAACCKANGNESAKQTSPSRKDLVP